VRRSAISTLVSHCSLWRWDSELSPSGGPNELHTRAQHAYSGLPRRSPIVKLRPRRTRRRGERRTATERTRAPPVARSQAAHAGRSAGLVVAQRLASAPPQTQSPPTSGCVNVGGGVCEAPGPAATGHGCPAGSVPNADGGVVCVPQSAIQQANGGIPNVNTPQGQQALQSPQCAGTPPPPPGYTAPVQC